jgi:hypothetical protein
MVDGVSLASDTHWILLTKQSPEYRSVDDSSILMRMSPQEIFEHPGGRQG